MSKVISADSHVQEPPELYERIPKSLRQHRASERDGARYLIVRAATAPARSSARMIGEVDRASPIWSATLAESSIRTSRVCSCRRRPSSQCRTTRRATAIAHRWRWPRYRAAVEVAAAKLGYVDGRTLQPAGDEPLWSAIEGAGLVLAFHAFTQDTYPEDWGEEEGIGGALDFMACAWRGLPVASGGVCARHPKLDFVVVECGAGWLAWLLHVRRQVEKKHMWVRPRLEPSEYFARQGFIEARLAQH